MKTFDNFYNLIISPESLFIAWKRFSRDKRKKKDVLQFEWNLEQNIFALHRELKNKTYKHGAYSSFYITDPKQRHIHKATVRDRVLHHSIARALTPLFEPTFIANSFSCRVGKGTHRGVKSVEKMLRKMSQNYTKPCYVLKCDIKKFFDSVDHATLIEVIERRIKDENVRWLIREIIGSYSSAFARERERVKSCAKKGIPIGNLTSQLFANVYMNEFDQFIKHELKIKYYARYTDDFVIVASNKKYLINLISPLAAFLKEKLFLDLHPSKVSIFSLSHGIDFLGYVVRPHHVLVRTKTRQRIVKKLKIKTFLYNEGVATEKSFKGTLESYLGILLHADAHDFSEQLKNEMWFLKGK